MTAAAQSLARFEDRLDLEQMVNVMTGHHAGDGGNGLLAALGVHAKLLELFGPQELQQIDITVPEGAESRERFLNGTLGVVHGRRPGVLIEAEDLGAWGSGDGAYAVAHRELGISKMRDDFRNRPFAGRGTFGETCRRFAGHQPFDSFRRGGTDFFGRFVFKMAQNSLAVLLRSFGHMSAPSAQRFRKRHDDEAAEAPLQGPFWKLRGTRKRSGLRKLALRLALGRRNPKQTCALGRRRQGTPR